MSGVVVPAWVQKARYSLHPQWENLVKQVEDRFEETKGHSDALYRQYEDLSRKAQSRNASSSAQQGKGKASISKKELRIKIKSVLHHLDELQSKLDNQQTSFESTLIREVNLFMKSLADDFLQNSRLEKKKLSENIEEYSKYWISQLKYNNNRSGTKRDRKGYPLQRKGPEAKHAEENKGKNTIRAGEKDKDDQPPQEEQQGKSADLERCQASLKKVQSKNKALNERVAQLSREKQEKQDENYRLKVQMQGLVDGLKKKAEEVQALRSLEGSPNPKELLNFPHKFSHKQSPHRKLQSKRELLWESSERELLCWVTNAKERDPGKADERKEDADQINRRPAPFSDTSKEILIVVPNLRSTSIVPFSVVNASTYNHKKLELSLADDTNNVNVVESEGKKFRSHNVLCENVTFFEILKNQAFSLPSWDKRLCRRRLDLESDRLRSLRKEMESSSTSNGNFLLTYSKFKNGLRKAQKELESIVTNEGSWQAHICLVIQRIKQFLVRIGEPEGWVEDQRAIRHFLEGSPEECSDNILNVVTSYEDWLSHFTSKMAKFMDETDERLRQFLSSMEREKLVLQEHVSETHAGLQNVGNLMSAARALLSKFESKQQDTSKHTNTNGVLMLEFDKYEQYLSSVQEEREALVNAFASLCDLNRTLSQIQEKNIKLSARLQMIELQSTDDALASKVRSAISKLLQSRKELEQKGNQIRKYLTEELGVKGDTLDHALDPINFREYPEDDVAIPLFQRKLHDYDALTKFSHSHTLLYGRLSKGKPVLLHKLTLSRKMEKSKIVSLLLKLKGISHPCLLPTEDVCIQGETLFLQKTYLPDLITFDLWVRESNPNQVDLCDKFRQLLQCLAYLHRNSIFLCSLSTATILLANGHVKIAEFDVSALLDPFESYESESEDGASQQNASFIAMSMSAISETAKDKAQKQEHKNKKDGKGGKILDLQLFGEMLLRCFFPQLRRSQGEPLSILPRHENDHLRGLLNQLLEIGPGGSNAESKKKIQSADEVLAHPFFAGQEQISPTSLRGKVMAKEWKFLLVDEYRAQLQSGRAPLHLKLSKSNVVSSMLTVFEGLSKEDILRPLRFGYTSEDKLLTNFEAFNIFFKEVCHSKYGLMESFSGSVLPFPESKELRVFGTLGKILAKCVLDKVKIPKNYFNSSFYKFLRDEAPDLTDLTCFHPHYAYYLSKIFQKKDLAKLAELAQATDIAQEVWREKPLKLLQAVLSKMLLTSRGAQLNSMKTAFFSAVELKSHLSILTWSELQELLEETT